MTVSGRIEPRPLQVGNAGMHNSVPLLDYIAQGTTITPSQAGPGCIDIYNHCHEATPQLSAEARVSH